MEGNRELIAYCGLYCGSCRKFMDKKCPGCRKNDKAQWCKIRVCCQENNYSTCANCDMEPHECKKFNNFFSKLFALLFKSDREGCIKRIREAGEDTYAEDMSKKKEMTIKK
jgi:hypothetical protein